jgi:hypothetical protein
MQIYAFLFPSENKVTHDNITQGTDANLQQRSSAADAEAELAPDYHQAKFCADRSLTQSKTRLSCHFILAENAMVAWRQT